MPDTFNTSNVNLGTWNVIGRDQVTIANYYGNNQEFGTSTIVVPSFVHTMLTFWSIQPWSLKRATRYVLLLSLQMILIPLECHPGTRKKLIDDIIDALSPTSSPRMCWLNGRMGMGKSAVACSIAAELSKQGRLAASFFSLAELVAPVSNISSLTLPFNLLPLFRHWKDPLGQPFGILSSLVNVLATSFSNWSSNPLGRCSCPYLRIWSS